MYYQELQKCVTLLKFQLGRNMWIFNFATKIKCIQIVQGLVSKYRQVVNV